MQRLTLVGLSLVAKILARLSQILKQGSGTSLPGLLVEKFFLWAFEGWHEVYEQVIMISGTNGKTTTRALLVAIFEAEGYRVCTNRGGANILRGVCTSLLFDLHWSGRPKSKVAILEVEEASLPLLTKYFLPTDLILTNLFRDQLDAYGEIDKTLGYFQKTVINVSAKQKLGKLRVLVNADDPRLSGEALGWGVELWGFGLDLPADQKPAFESSDTVQWPSQSPLFLGKNITFGEGSYGFELDFRGERLKFETKLNGLYNLYNVLAASLIGLEKFGPKIRQAVQSIRPVFGRGEMVELANNKLVLYLVKNPAGFDMVLQTLRQIQTDQKFSLAVLINDKIADGRDVSWLWDIHLEDFVRSLPAGRLSRVVTGGTRGLDMLLRFQIAGQPVVLADNFDSLDDLVDFLEREKGFWVVLCTYTALLELRAKLSRKVNLPQISEAGN